MVRKKKRKTETPLLHRYSFFPRINFIPLFPTPLPLSRQAAQGNGEIPEWLRLDGTSGCLLVQRTMLKQGSLELVALDQ